MFFFFLHKVCLKLHRQTLTEPTADNSKGIVSVPLLYILILSVMMYVMSVLWISTFLYHYYASGKLYNVVVAFHGYQYKSFGTKWVFTAHWHHVCWLKEYNSCSSGFLVICPWQKIMSELSLGASICWGHSVLQTHVSSFFVVFFFSSNFRCTLSIGRHIFYNKLSKYFWKKSKPTMVIRSNTEFVNKCIEVGE